MRRKRGSKYVTSVREPARIILDSEGVPTLQIPHDETLINELRSLEKSTYQILGSSKWHLKTEVFETVIDIVSKHVREIQNLDLVMPSWYDKLQITPEMPLEIIKLVAKQHLIRIHPDRIRSDNYLTIYPDATDLEDAKNKADRDSATINQSLQEILSERGE